MHHLCTQNSSIALISLKTIHFPNHGQVPAWWIPGFFSELIFCHFPISHYVATLFFFSLCCPNTWSTFSCDICAHYLLCCGNFPLDVQLTQLSFLSSPLTSAMFLVIMPVPLLHDRCPLTLHSLTWLFSLHRVYMFIHFLFSHLECKSQRSLGIVTVMSCCCLQI